MCFSPYSKVSIQEYGPEIAVSLLSRNRSYMITLTIGIKGIMFINFGTRSYPLPTPTKIITCVVPFHACFPKIIGAVGFGSGLGMLYLNLDNISDVLVCKNKLIKY